VTRMLRQQRPRPFAPRLEPGAWAAGIRNQTNFHAPYVTRKAATTYNAEHAESHVRPPFSAAQNPEFVSADSPSAMRML